MVFKIGLMGSNISIKARGDYFGMLGRDFLYEGEL